jgi:hypothetical protein
MPSVNEIISLPINVAPPEVSNVTPRGIMDPKSTMMGIRFVDIPH